MGTSACGVQAGTSGNHSAHSHLSKLLSRYVPGSGVYRLDKKLVKHQGLYLRRGPGKEPEAEGVGLTSLLFGGNGSYLKYHHPGDRLSVSTWSLDPQGVRGDEETDPWRREAPFPGQTAKDLGRSMSGRVPRTANGVGPAELSFYGGKTES